MKKLLTIVLLFAGVVSASAQVGIVGGFTASNSAFKKGQIMENIKNVSLYHVGVCYKFNLGAGFAIQPGLTYEMKGARLANNMESESITVALQSLESKTGFLQLGAGVQWGIDLLVFRPFILVDPFIGVRLNGNDNYSEAFPIRDTEAASKALTNVKNRMEYGFGLGGGVEFGCSSELLKQHQSQVGQLENQSDGDDRQNRRR